MHELRVTPKEFKSLFDPNTDPDERTKIYKRVKLMCEDYPVITERLKLIEIKFELAQIKAGKYDQLQKTLKIK